MKALVIGYGSMGRRRIRLLRGLVENVDIVCVDSGGLCVVRGSGAGNRRKTACGVCLHIAGRPC